MSHSKLSQYIKSARQKQGLTLREVARRSGNKISNAHVSSLETGRCKNPSPHVLWFISKGIKGDYFKMMELAGYIVQSKGMRK